MGSPPPEEEGCDLKTIFKEEVIHLWTPCQNVGPSHPVPRQAQRHVGVWLTAGVELLELKRRSVARPSKISLPGI